VYSINPPGPGAPISPVSTNIWFGGTLIVEASEPAYIDRLGTNRAGFTSSGYPTSERFYPYGDEITSTLNDHEKFGTYTRDGYTGFDYADQRYYASTYGRFNTADPYRASGRTGDPMSWNRYSYALGDPVNSNDPSGLDSFMGITPLECQIYDIDNECQTLANEFNLDGGGGSVAGVTTSVDDSGNVVFSINDDVSGNATSADTSSDSSDDNSDGVPPDPEPNPASEPVPTFTATGTATVNSCVAQAVALGAVVGAGVGGGVLGTMGGAVGAVGGTAIEPGGGTAVLGVVGFEVGETWGAIGGASIGSAVGGFFGNIFCRRGGGGSRKGERKRAARPDGTRNAGKHVRRDPNNPGRWIFRDPNTGKETLKPPGWTPESGR
jgi:RHS repeat-associated protein